MDDYHAVYLFLETGKTFKSIRCEYENAFFVLDRFLDTNDQLPRPFLYLETDMSKIDAAIDCYAIGKY